MREILDQLIYPNPLFLFGLMIMIFIDLLTGIQKANKRGQATTSRGFRYSFDKATTYFSLILSALVIINITSLADKVHRFDDWLDYSINSLIIFCAYVELKSVLENLIVINSNDGKPNFIARMLLIKMHNALILKFKSNDTYCYKGPTS